MPPVELRHLRYFVAVVESRNFTRAAQRLHVAQPALSRQIQDLESELGVTLLRRSPRGARPTPAGEAFATEARAVLERAAEAVRIARAFASGERGELHLGYAPSPTVELLPRILHAYQSEAPGVRVVLHDLTSSELVSGLRHGSLQAALMVQPDPAGLRGLAFEELCRYPVCAAVPRDHPLARSRTLPVKRLAGERFVAYSRSEYPEYHALLHSLFDSLRPRPVIAEEHDSATSLIAAVEARRGLAVVASALACLAGPRLRVIELRPAPSPLVVGMAYDPRQLTPAAERLVNLGRALPKVPRRV